MPPSVVSVTNLCKNYKSIQAVDDISFTVENGEIFALVGPNGAGKSTTLKILATILSPTSGEVSIAGYNLKEESDKIRQIMSYLPEEAGAYKNMTGIQYLKFMAAILTDSQETQKKYLDFALEISDLQERITDKVKTYSKGMVRKLLIARTVMNKPKLTILDEPTSGLDVLNAHTVRNIIKNLTANGMSVILSSHNMLETEYLSDRIGLIAKGKIVEIGTTAELKKKYHSKNLEEVFLTATQKK